MCNCQTWCRIPINTKYPQPLHHQDCEDYKLERFVRVVYDGTPCVVEPGDVEALIGASEGYEISDVMLTRDQFERMPEFDGF
jgi:hypothetical protein